MTSLDPQAVANVWLDAFQRAAGAADVDAFVNLFLPIGWLRGASHYPPGIASQAEGIAPLV